MLLVIGTSNFEAQLYRSLFNLKRDIAVNFAHLLPHFSGSRLEYKLPWAILEEKSAA